MCAHSARAMRVKWAQSARKVRPQCAQSARKVHATCVRSARKVRTKSAQITREVRSVCTGHVSLDGYVYLSRDTCPVALGASRRRICRWPCTEITAERRLRRAPERRFCGRSAHSTSLPLRPSPHTPLVERLCPLPPSPVDSSNLPTRWSRGPESVLYIVIYVYWHRMTPAGDLQRQRSGTQPSRRASSGAWPGGLRGVALSCGARTQARARAEVAAGPWSRRRSRQWSKAGGPICLLQQLQARPPGVFFGGRTDGRSGRQTATGPATYR